MWLLTTMSLVRVRPGEPINSVGWDLLSQPAAVGGGYRLRVDTDAILDLWPVVPPATSGAIAKGKARRINRVDLFMAQDPFLARRECALRFSLRALVRPLFLKQTWSPG